MVVMTMFVSSDVELWSENGGWTYDLTLDVGSLAQAMLLRRPPREHEFGRFEHLGADD